MMRIKDQKALGHDLLKKIQGAFPDAVLAGGAPRDWYFEKEAKDLDFFIPHKPEPALASRATGLVVEEAADKDYTGATFTVYNVLGLAMPVQIIFCQARSSKEIVDRFPCNLSKAWYDGEESHYDPSFLLGVRYGYVIGYPSALVDKTFEKYPGFKYWAFTERSFLKCLGGKMDTVRYPRKRKAWGAPPLDLEDLRRNYFNGGGGMIDF